VRILERTNIRYLTPDVLGETAQGAVIDVSFISLEQVVPTVGNLLVPEGDMIALIKPQFEVGRGQVGKGGVVRDPDLHRDVIARLRRFFEKEGWQTQGPIPAPLMGPKGNREFLMHLVRDRPA
jgi:23S rRNA (cytidine1920-2'-O)/16S rRNA (cytidine1409-2'-O)-methyltransferase